MKVLESCLAIDLKAGIILHSKKNKLFKRSVDYLWQIITKDGIKMKEYFVERVVNWPTPTTIKELNTFLGFTGYYQNFLKDYSTVTTEKMDKGSLNHSIGLLSWNKSSMP